MTSNETPKKFERQIGPRHIQKFVELATQSEPHWWKDLLSLWCPSGVDSGKFGLRLAIRNGYLNFYRHGQSIARVEIDRKGPMVTTHIKYVFDQQDQSVGSEYVTLRDDWILRTGEKWKPYRGLADIEKWIDAVDNTSHPNGRQGYAGVEKIFVDKVVAANPNIIDLEMGLPAWKEPKTAPRIDLVEIAATSNGCRVVFWEAKLTSDGRMRSSKEVVMGESPEVLQQLADYREYLSAEERGQWIIDAYKNTAILLKQFQTMARFQNLGAAIEDVAGGEVLELDREPRLIVQKCEKLADWDKHEGKLRATRVAMQVVEIGGPFELRAPT